MHPAFIFRSEPAFSSPRTARASSRNQRTSQAALLFSHAHYRVCDNGEQRHREYHPRAMPGIPVSIPTTSPIIVAMPNVCAFVRNSMNGIPPPMGITTDRSGMNIGINPSIEAAKHTTIIIAENIPKVIRSLGYILFCSYAPLVSFD